jgi:hypothetical protein
MRPWPWSVLLFYFFNFAARRGLNSKNWSKQKMMPFAARRSGAQTSFNSFRIAIHRKELE